MTNALDLLDDAIAELEAKLNLKPGQDLPSTPDTRTKPQQTPQQKPQQQQPQQKQGKKKNKAAPAANKSNNTPSPPPAHDILKLDIRVGQIVKVWVHPDAEKLYCEEIDVGEESPRQIASGLRPHFSLEEMQGQRLLVVANLKAKNLVGFKSHGMVLCAAKATADGGEKVEFIEPPPEAAVGEAVTFAGLDPPQPITPSQVEKKKVFVACLQGLKTTDDCLATWDGHVFTTSAGPCKAKTIAGGSIR